MKKIIKLIEKYSKLVHHHNRQFISVQIHNDWSGHVLDDDDNLIVELEFESKKELKSKLKAEIKLLKKC